MYCVKSCRHVKSYCDCSLRLFLFIEVCCDYIVDDVESNCSRMFFQESMMVAFNLNIVGDL